jgi:NAD-dependent SIR2 family protein deacetylase
MSLDSDAIDRAAELVAGAAGIFVGAGAGMGVDSGLPDFRGRQGFWRAYPPFARLGLGFEDLANPSWFRRDPQLAWGFYGHRLALYRTTVPHAGFTLLARWAERTPHGLFVFTSNVDGQFQRAGIAPERVVECHGSIHHLQCAKACTNEIWSAESTEVTVDRECRAEPPLPKCPHCGSVARPNILMFGDAGWLSARTEEQEQRLDEWLDRVERDPIVVIEAGAGTNVPTVRWHCENMAGRAGTPLVRINPREPDGPRDTISLPAGALEALRAIDGVLERAAP